jgi:phage shock protein A
MPLITRISRLFRADFNAVLDNIEEPDVLLRQAIREMEEDVVANEQQLKWLHHECTELNSRREDLRQRLQQINEELSLCFESGKDELARGLVKRKLEAQRLEQRINNRCETTVKSIEQLEARITEHSNTLESMRQKAALFADATGLDRRDTDPSGEWSGNSIHINDGDIEVALLREKKLRSES